MIPQPPKNGEQFADSHIVSRQELIEFLPDDYRVDLDGSEYILRLIRIGQADSRGSAMALEQGIVEPTTLPEFTNIRCMGAEHKRRRENPRPFTEPITLLEST